MFMLNLAPISGLTLESLPAKALARAAGNQVLANGAFGKFCRRLVVPAEPSVAVVAVQPRGSQLARIVMVGPLFSVWPQILAANWKAFSRCSPRVVPVFPPTGDTGVGSLNPTPAASLFRMTIVDCPDAEEAATRLTASITRKIENFLRTHLITSLNWRFGFHRLKIGLIRFDQLRIDAIKSRCRFRVIDAGC